MWTLLLSQRNAAPGLFLDRRQIDSGQISIGHDLGTCDWILPDLAGDIAQEHCTIAIVGLHLFVTDTSTNGVWLNTADQRIVPQQPVAVRVGDRLLLGNYVIEIVTAAAGFGAHLAPAMEFIPDAPTTPVAHTQFEPWFRLAPAMEFIPDAPTAPVVRAQFDPWFRPGAAEDPVWGVASSAVMHEFLALPVTRHAAPRPGEVFDPNPLREAFDRPLQADRGSIEGSASMPLSNERALPASPCPVPGPWGLAPNGPDTNTEIQIGAMFPDNMPQPLEALASPTCGVGLVDRDPFSSLPLPSAKVGSDAGWMAFCEGAGLDPTDVRQTPDTMRRLGMLYREMVASLSGLVQERAFVGVTAPGRRSPVSVGCANPFEHLSPPDCVRLLLADPKPGFMQATEAVRAATQDVTARQQASYASMGETLRRVVQRLSPVEVERVAAKPKARQHRLSLRRRTDPWNLYQVMFEAVHQDAVSHADGVMSFPSHKANKANWKRVKTERHR